MAVRIGILTELFPPSVGGQEVRFSELAEALAERGHTVRVLTIRHDNTLPKEEVLASGVGVTRAPYIANYRHKHGSMFPRSVMGIVRYAFFARAWLARERFDLTLLNQWPLLHVLALTRRDRAHALVDWCEIRDAPHYRFFQYLLPRLVIGNTAVSNDVHRHILARSAGPVLMMPSGIMRERYHAADAGSRGGLLYLGRLAHHKGVMLLVASFEELCRRGYTETLTIAGGGTAQGEIEAAVAASPFGSRISMLGLVSETKKLDLLAHARLLILPSQREGFPRVVAEAMASALPTITTRYPGNGTVGVVEEYQCGVCAEPTSAGVADAIQTALENWGHYSEMAERGAARLNWKTIVLDFENFVGRLNSNQNGKLAGPAIQAQIVEH